MQRSLSRAKRGTNGAATAKVRSPVRAREADPRKDWAEKASTDIARRYDVIRIEDLKIGNMTRSAKGTIDGAGPERPAEGRPEPGDPASGWGLFAKRLEDKAPGRVEKINPRFTSERCSACGHVDREEPQEPSVPLPRLRLHRQR